VGVDKDLDCDSDTGDAEVGDSGNSSVSEVGSDKGSSVSGAALGSCAGNGVTEGTTHAERIRTSSKLQTKTGYL